jgi:tight adherence protein B
MLSAIIGNSFLVLTVLVFVACLLLFESAYILWRSRRGPQAMKLRSRLSALNATADRSVGSRLLRQRVLSELPAMERYLQRMPRMRALDRMILQSGLQWSVGKLLFSSLALAVGAWAMMTTQLHQGHLWGAAVALVIGALPVIYVRHRRTKRLARLERQLPDALDMLTRALRSGHAFSSALKMAGEEMPEPIASELSTVHDEVNFGVSLDQALGHLAERVPLTDLRYFVVAVLIQRESGGNLTEILSNLSHLIRERLKLMARVRVLSSEGRLSAWILGLMPFFLAGVMNLVNPDFMSPLWTDPIGITIIKYILSMMLVGAIIMTKIIKIRY